MCTAEVPTSQSIVQRPLNTQKQRGGAGAGRRTCEARGRLPSLVLRAELGLLVASDSCNVNSLS